jgi:hypothetical protein
MTKFAGDGWNSEDLSSLKREFDISDKELEGVNVLYANYTLGCYEGEALVVFEKEGKLYEVNGSHCSCYGLEGMWEPEETTKEALLTRPKNTYLCNIEYLEECLKDF